MSPSGIVSILPGPRTWSVLPGRPTGWVTAWLGSASGGVEESAPICPKPVPDPSVRGPNVAASREAWMPLDVLLGPVRASSGRFAGTRASRATRPLTALGTQEIAGSMPARTTPVAPSFRLEALACDPFCDLIVALQTSARGTWSNLGARCCPAVVLIGTQVLVVPVEVAQRRFLLLCGLRRGSVWCQVRVSISSRMRWRSTTRWPLRSVSSRWPSENRSARTWAMSSIRHCSRVASASRSGST